MDEKIKEVKNVVNFYNYHESLDELDNYSYIYNPNTRNVSYSAPSGMHDDGVIATALAWHSRKDFSNKGKYMALRVWWN